MTDRLLLAINPGSTSTKFAVYSEENQLFVKNIEHSVEQLTPYTRISDQFTFRKELIIGEIINAGFDISHIEAVVGRGGLLKPIESGVYEVNDTMINDLKAGLRGEHASNLGGLIARDIADSLPGVKAYIVDPVVVDEMDPVARISGHPEIERISIFHALNQKAVARSYAAGISVPYEDLNLIVAHMGGGISVGAHRKGRVVDVNNALDGDGPFSPERSGGLPAGQLAALCFSGKYTYPQIKGMITGKGGISAYMGTNNFRDLCRMADEGDSRALLIKKALAYQVGKEIGAMAAVLEGKVDAILLTGGMAHQASLIEDIRCMTTHIADIKVFAGEDELRSLVFNVLLAIDGKITVREYS